METRKQFVTEMEFDEEVFAMLKVCFEAEVTFDAQTGRTAVVFEDGTRFVIAVEELC